MPANVARAKLYQDIFGDGVERPEDRAEEPPGRDIQRKRRYRSDHRDRHDQHEEHRPEGSRCEKVGLDAVGSQHDPEVELPLEEDGEQNEGESSCAPGCPLDDRSHRSSLPRTYVIDRVRVVMPSATATRADSGTSTHASSVNGSEAIRTAVKSSAQRSSTCFEPQISQS